jgi:transcription elongation factor SPT6
MCVFIDESGRVRETVKLDNLEIKHASAFDQQNEQGESSKPADDFKEFVQRRKPAVIVVGGLSYSTHRLTKNVKALITTLAEETIKQDEEEAGGRRPEQSEQEREQSLKDATIPVIYVSDNVARIYQHSLRAQQEFPTQPTTGRYCIGLGRFAQSPIHEFCALAADISAITFNEDSQNLVSFHGVVPSQTSAERGTDDRVDF